VKRRNITYDLTVAVAAIALVSVLPVHGWQLVMLCAVLLALRFGPRTDAASRRERRLEKASDAFARDFTDTLEIVHRGSPRCSAPNRCRSRSADQTATFAKPSTRTAAADAPQSL
jgi:Flp pilus assembly protein TadB